MVKGSRQSSSIDNSGALFLGLGPFFLLLRLATLWFGSIFIAIPLQATALHAPRFFIIQLFRWESWCSLPLGVWHGFLRWKLGPFPWSSGTCVGMATMADVSPAHRPVRVAHPSCIFLISPSLGEACCGTVWCTWWCISTMGCKFHAQVAEDEHTSQKNPCEMSATWKNAWNHERVEGFGTAADSALDFRGSVVCTAVACDSWGHGKVGSLISREANFWPAYPVPSLCGLRLRRGMGSFLFSSVAFHVNKFHLIQRKRKIRQLHLETSARDSGQCGPHPQYTRSMMVLVADLVQPVDLNALRPTFYLIWRCWSCFGKWRQGANEPSGAEAKHKEIASMDIVLQETTLVFADQAKPRTNHSPVPLQEPLVVSLLDLFLWILERPMLVRTVIRGGQTAGCVSNVRADVETLTAQEPQILAGEPRCWQVGFVLWLAMKQGLMHWEGGAFNQGQAKVWVINEFSKARRACKVGSEQYCATAQPVTHAIYLAKSIDTTWHRHLKYIASSVTSRVTSRNCQQFFGLGDLGRLFQPCSTDRTWLVSSAGAMDSFVPGFSLSLKFLPLLDAWALSQPDVYPGPIGEEASVCFGASIVKIYGFRLQTISDKSNLDRLWSSGAHLGDWVQTMEASWTYSAWFAFQFPCLKIIFQISNRKKATVDSN